MHFQTSCLGYLPQPSASAKLISQFRQFMISTQLHPIHIELLITTFTISQTGRRCATQLGEGEGSSQCPGEETEKVWSGWFSLELLARCLTPFVFRHWQVTVRIQIWVEDEGLMMELTARRNSKLGKKFQEALILAVKYRRFTHRLKLMNNVLLCKVCFAHTEPGCHRRLSFVIRWLVLPW